MVELSSRLTALATQNNATLATTVASALARGKTDLRGEPREVEWLLGYVLNWPRIRLFTHSEQLLTSDQQAHYETLLMRRIQGEPLPYLLGRWEFWSLELTVSPSVLIPRPETELLVELALALIPLDVSWTVADLGTGSGAIALAVATERPACRIIATDCCPAALTIAQANAHRLGLANVEFRTGDWCAPLAGQCFNLILSNPPYVAVADPHLDDLRFEPQLALTAGPDGLAAIRLIIATARDYLYPGGRLLLEHGYDQGASVRQLLTKRDYTELETRFDLEGRERVTLAKAGRFVMN
ncbi:protein-(glutamine-N(5)) methyltransferase [Gammaproteobacteria bacterium]